MKDMWALLDTYNLRPTGEDRPVNHVNEWGGYSRRLNMPVFTGWQDQTTYDKENKTTASQVSDTTWNGTVGVNNQEYWLAYAEQYNDAIAAFFIIRAVDVNEAPRRVKDIDSGKVFLGKIVRDGTATYIVGQPKIL